MEMPSSLGFAGMSRIPHSLSLGGQSSHRLGQSRKWYWWQLEGAYRHTITEMLEGILCTFPKGIIM
jgi:hypothetical protein